MKLLLASRSAARRAMLEAAGIPFEPVQAMLDEAAAKSALWSAGFDARGVAEELALRKALSAAAGAGDLVLGSDQTLERDDGTLLGKPASPAEARGQLLSLAGATHKLHAAAAIVQGGGAVWRHCETVELTMRPLGDAFLDSYLEREWEAIRWCVGGYRIEGLGAQLFDRIQGSHFAILGMPLLPLLADLRERGLLPA
jgi:septum formation protein